MTYNDSIECVTKGGDRIDAKVVYSVGSNVLVWLGNRPTWFKERNVIFTEDNQIKIPIPESMIRIVFDRAKDYLSKGPIKISPKDLDMTAAQLTGNWLKTLMYEQATNY